MKIIIIKKKFKRSLYQMKWLIVDHNNCALFILNVFLMFIWSFSFRWSVWGFQKLASIEECLNVERYDILRTQLNTCFYILKIPWLTRYFEDIQLPLFLQICYLIFPNFSRRTVDTKAIDNFVFNKAVCLFTIHVNMI